MEDIKSKSMLSVAACVVIYLLGAFASVSFNIKEWEVVLRVSCVVFMGVAVFEIFTNNKK